MLVQKLLGNRLGKPLCGFQKLAKGMDLVLATSIVFDEKSSLIALELESPAIALSVSTTLFVAAAPVANLFCTVLNP